PVDLDYKGLANCGTWLLGRLQTERDKLRVLDGLEGASTQAGAAFDRAKMEQILSGLGKRVFLMHNVHEDQPVVLQSRWAMSYLRGPLTREQISALMKERKAAVAESATPGGTPTALRGRDSGAASQDRPVLPPEIAERFLPLRATVPTGGRVVYRPALLGMAKVHFAQAASGVDVWKSLSLIVPVDAEVPPDVWTTGEASEDDPPELESAPATPAQFFPLPAELSRPKKYAALATALRDHLYRSQKQQLWKCAALKQVSRAGESEADFRVRLSQSGREKRDAQLEKLRQKFNPKMATLSEQIRKAQARVAKEKSQSTQQMLGTALSFGSTVLGALMGRKLTSVTNVTRATSTMKSAGRIFREQQDVSQAGDTEEAYRERFAALDAEFRAEAEKIQAGLDADQLELEVIAIQPKKADITVGQVVLIWEPWVLATEGTMQKGT
ncbi:MAG: ATP-binding protein, partial [Pirellulaceae bacterium]|nr:ATP-binding protein [Pirellulaceae bacterium]